MIGWFVLLAFLFAATNVDAVNEGFGSLIAVFTSAEMDQNWAEAILVIACVGQFFCGMACVTSSSRTFFAFSRDRAVPGHGLWSRVSAKGVPSMAVLGSTVLAFLIVLPALFASDTFVPPVAFFAVTAIGTIGLYIAYVIPVFLRWRMGDAFEVRSWTLGPRYKWINAIAVVFVAVMFVVLMLPTNTFGVPWEGDFDWSFFNYTPAGRRTRPARHVARLGAGRQEQLQGTDSPDRVRRGDGHRRGEARGRCRRAAARRVAAPPPRSGRALA